MVGLMRMARSVLVFTPIPGEPSIAFSSRDETEHSAFTT